MNVRPAESRDAAGIARVHVESWQTSYTGIVPQIYLDRLSIERRTEGWQRILSESRENILVAQTNEGEIIGFVNGGKEREDLPGYDGELYAIYLLKKAQGQGVGRKLFNGIVKILAEQGFNNMTLWVFKDNNTARQFYERLGGQLIAQKTFTLAEVDLIEVAYGWKDIKGWLTTQG